MKLSEIPEECRVKQFEIERVHDEIMVGEMSPTEFHKWLASRGMPVTREWK